MSICLYHCTFFSGSFACCWFRIVDVITSPTRAITTLQDVLHTLMLTPPLGHRGNANAHSMYHGNQPRGYVKMGVLACQNCNKKRTPVVPTHLTTVALVSKLDRVDETAVATGCQWFAKSTRKYRPLLSYSAMILSCCLRILAHLAKSSCALIPLISALSLSTSRRSCSCSLISADVLKGIRHHNCHNLKFYQPIIFARRLFG